MMQPRLPITRVIGGHHRLPFAYVEPCCRPGSDRRSSRALTNSCDPFCDHPFTAESSRNAPYYQAFFARLVSRVGIADRWSTKMAGRTVVTTFAIQEVAFRFAGFGPAECHGNARGIAIFSIFQWCRVRGLNSRPTVYKTANLRAQP